MITVGSVAVDVVPSTKLFAEKLKAALQPIADKIGLQMGETIGDKIADAMPKAGEKAGGFFSDTFKKRVELALKNLPDASVKLDDAKAQEKLDALRAKLTLLGKARIGIDIDAGKAEAELLALKAETDALAGTSGGESGGFTGLTNSIGETTSGFSPLIGAAILFGSTLIPIIAVVSAGLGGIVAVLSTAAAGFGVFAGFAIPAITGALAGQAKLDAAKLAVENATTPKQRATALLQEKQATENLSGSQLAFLGVLNQVKGAYNAIAKAAAPAVLGAVSAVLKAAIPLIQSLSPLLTAVTPVIAGLGGTLAATFSGAGWHAFMAFLAKEAPLAMQGLFTIALNVGKIIANLVVAFAPIGNLVLGALSKGIADIATSTGNLSNNKGFQQFIAYAIKEAPVVGKFFLELVKAALALAVVFAPLGDLMLKVLTPILGMVASHADIFVLALGAAFVALGVALIFVSESNPIGLILTGIVLLAVGIIELVAIIVKHFTAIKNFLEQWGPLILAVFFPIIGIPLLIWQHWSLISKYVGDALSTAYTTVKRWLTTIWSDVSNFVLGVVNAVVGFFEKLPGRVVSGLQIGFAAVIRFFAALPGRIAFAIGYQIGLMIRVFIDAVKDIYTAVVEGVPAVIRFFAALPGKILNALSSLGSVLLTAGLNGIRALARGIANGLVAVTSFVEGIPGKIISALVDLGPKMASSGKAGGKSFLSGLIDGFKAVLDWLGGLADKIFSVIGNLPSLFLQFGKNVIGQFVSGIEGAAKSVGGGILGLAEKAVSGVEKGIGGNATGGLITGPGSGTSDSILRRLSNGEFVVNAAATAKNLGLLSSLNSGLTPTMPSYDIASNALGGNIDPSALKLLRSIDAKLAYLPQVGADVGRGVNAAGGASVLRTRSLPGGARP